MEFKPLFSIEFQLLLSVIYRNLSIDKFFDLA